jgi:hypothetical protein
MLLSISVYSEFRDDDLDHARVEITPALARRLKLLQNTVKKVGATYIEEWDTPELLDSNDEDSETSIDCVTLKVSDTDFHWEGNLKNTEVRWETRCGNFDEVNEVLRVAKTLRKNLPLLIGKLDFDDAKKLLEKRLKACHS